MLDSHTDPLAEDMLISYAVLATLAFAAATGLAYLWFRPERWTRIVCSTDRKPAALDDDGFLADVEAWNRDLGLQIAAAHGITAMTRAHWAVIC